MKLAIDDSWLDGLCAVLADGSVSCIDQPLTSTTAVPIEGLSDVGSLAGGQKFYCALNRAADVVRCWGSKASGQLGTGGDLSYVAATGFGAATALSVGEDYLCGIIDGKVRCWGGNASGQLGNGTTEPSRVPVEVVGLSGVRGLATGFSHTCAIDEHQEVWCWGNNNVGGNLQGALGDGTNISSAVPKSTGLVGALQVSAGFGASCALVGTEVWCWGDNSYGQTVQPLPNNDPWALRPVDTGVGDMVQISVSDGRWCGLKRSGEIACFGKVEMLDPLQPGPPPQATFVSNGADHICGLQPDGSVFCWGSNYYGAAPGVVPGVTNAVAIASGVGYFAKSSCALDAGGGVRCWGWSSVGQLGDGTTLPGPRSAEPVREVLGARLLAVGSQFGCALLASGDVRCWGTNVVDGDYQGASPVRFPRP
ncbi:MAG: hypothetical protein U1E65_23085 [Myxococcota bacterium]